MIEIAKLRTLHGRIRTRKATLVLERIERDMAARRRRSPAGMFERGLAAQDYADIAFLREMAEFLSADSESTAALAECASKFLRNTADLRDLDGVCKRVLRAINDFRHECMAISGQACADWDLIDYTEPRAGSPGAEGLSPECSSHEPAPSARPFPGLAVYLEALRSPFNVGTIFRTAEAFGFGEILLSPDCADPRHPRAMRSSMGTIDMIPWRRAALSELANEKPVFALELGGTPLGEFRFPPSGVLVVGSEELGVSEDALAACAYGRVSIPMRGHKASINAAVAFGIAADAWVAKISN